MPGTAMDSLTPREREILALLPQGRLYEGNCGATGHQPGTVWRTCMQFMHNACAIGIHAVVR